MGFQGIAISRLLRRIGTRQPLLLKGVVINIQLLIFGSKNVPAIFSRVVAATFREFIHKFLEVYFDDWKIFGLLQKHIENLRMMFDRCRKYQIALNLKKCIFCSPFGILLGHVVCKHRLIIDHAKIVVIVNFPPPTSM